MIENDFTKKKNFFNNFGNLLYIETEKILNFPLLISYPFSSQSYWINNMSKKHRRRRRRDKMYELQKKKNRCQYILFYCGFAKSEC